MRALPHFKSLLLAGGIALLGAVQPAAAVVLMFDFGSTEVTGTDRTNSPYHSASGFDGTTWNVRDRTDAASGLLYADGTAATGVALNLGAVTNSNAVSMATQPSNISALGSVSNTLNYEGTSAAKDGIFHGGSQGGDPRTLGFQVTGLAAGTYDVYVTARNTSLSGSHTQQLFYNSTGTAGDFDVTSYSTQTIVYDNGNDGVGLWVEGDNYFKFTISLSEGGVLNLATRGTAGDMRAFLNSVQIVTVPEPGSGLLLLGAGAVAVFVRRRRR